MPLAFQSISHGPVAFGFFNIESDMLLLDRYFFFASDFCNQVSALARMTDEPVLHTNWRVFHIPAPTDIGDLMGAIHGVHFSGFIGALYRKFPFPEREENFKQNPEGHRTRVETEHLICHYAVPMDIPVALDAPRDEAAIGEYRFEGQSFQGLIRYVWQGGYPRWRDGIRPGYVVEMKKTLEAHSYGLFQGIDLTE